MSRAWVGGSDRRWRQFRDHVLARDGWACQLRLPQCVGTATEVDHIVPMSVAPARKLDPTNARAACAPCNRGRGAMPDHALPRRAKPSRSW